MPNLFLFLYGVAVSEVFVPIAVWLVRDVITIMFISGSLPRPMLGFVCHNNRWGGRVGSSLHCPLLLKTASGSFVFPTRAHH